jgi:hypothetical protein
MVKNIIKIKYNEYTKPDMTVGLIGFLYFNNI